MKRSRITLLSLGVLLSATAHADHIALRLDSNSSIPYHCKIYAAYWDGDRRRVTCTAEFNRHSDSGDNARANCKDGGRIDHVNDDDSSVWLTTNGRCASGDLLIEAVKAKKTRGRDKYSEASIFWFPKEHIYGTGITAEVYSARHTSDSVARNGRLVFGELNLAHIGTDRLFTVDVADRHNICVWYRRGGNCRKRAKAKRLALINDRAYRYTRHFVPSQ